MLQWLFGKNCAKQSRNSRQPSVGDWRIRQSKPDTFWIEVYGDNVFHKPGITHGYMITEIGYNFWCAYTYHIPNTPDSLRYDTYAVKYFPSMEDAKYFWLDRLERIRLADEEKKCNNNVFYPPSFERESYDA